MPLSQTITCDNCEKDITKTGAMPTFRLKLSSEALPQEGGITFAVVVYPLLDGDKYFCDRICLVEWLEQS